MVHQEAMSHSTSMASTFAGKLPRAAPGWAAPPTPAAAGGRRFKSDASSDEDVGSFQPAESKEPPLQVSCRCRVCQSGEGVCVTPPLPPGQISRSSGGSWRLAFVTTRAPTCSSLLGR